jgi:predicted nucleic acid-binding protein
LRILIDTDILLDLALDRNPHADGAARVIDAVQRGSVSGIVAWHTISNLYYILTSFSDRKRALGFVRDLAAIVDVAPADSATLDIALSLDMRDFEDAMQVAAALAAGVEKIVTRNSRDFRRSPITVVAPAELQFPG